MRISNKEICIIGTGGFAREILCLITDLGEYSKVAAFLEPHEIWEKNWKDKKIMGIPVLSQETFNPETTSVVIGIGNSKIREKVVNQLPESTSYQTLIHPTAIVSKWVDIGEGCIICAGSILTCNVKLGKHSQLNLHTTIGHDCLIGDFFTTAPSVNISGDCTFDKHVYYGTASAVRQGITICKNVTIGMGAMVVKNIVDPGTYIGIPAKKIKQTHV